MGSPLGWASGWPTRLHKEETGWGWASPIDPCDPRSCFLWSSQTIIWLSFHFCVLNQYLSINLTFLLKLAKGNFCCSQPNRNLSCNWSRGRSGTSQGYTTNFFSLFPSLWMSAVQEIIVAKGRMFLPRDPIMASLIWREDCLRLLMEPANRQKGSHKEQGIEWSWDTSFLLTLAAKLPHYCHITQTRSVRAQICQE